MIENVVIFTTGMVLLPLVLVGTLIGVFKLMAHVQSKRLLQEFKKENSLEED